MTQPYPTDLTDAQWELVAPHIPPARGRRRVDIRRVVDAISYITRAGCQWRMLPTDFPSWRTVHDYHTTWQFNGTWRGITDALRRRVRREQHPAAGEEPAAARIDSQSVRGGGPGGGHRDRRREAGKRPEAAHRRRQLGPPAGRRGDGGECGRRPGRPAGAGRPPGVRPGRVCRLDIPYLSAVRVHRRDKGRAQVTDREPPAGDERVGDVTPPVGGRTDLRVARPVPPSQPGLREAGVYE